MATRDYYPSSLVFTDPHVGNMAHDDGEGFRRVEAENVMGELAEALGRSGCARLVCAGDLFHPLNRKPQAWAYRAVNRLRDEARARAIDIRAIPGNHDAALMGQVSPLEVVFDGSELVTRPTVEVTNGVQWVFVPWFSRAHLAALMPEHDSSTQEFVAVDALKSALAQLSLVEGYPTVVVTHFTISGARWDSDEQPMIGETSELMLPRDLFPADRFELVLSGHIHTAQELAHIDGYADVTYIGATTRNGFGQERHTPRYLELQVIEGRLNVFEHEVKSSLEFLTIPVETLLGSEFPLASLFSPEGKIVRFKGELPPGAESVARLEAWRKEALEAGAVKVAKPAVTFMRHEHKVVSTLTTATRPEDALGEYADAVGGEYVGRLEELRPMHAELLEVVRNA